MISNHAQQDILLGILPISGFFLCLVIFKLFKLSLFTHMLHIMYSKYIFGEIHCCFRVVHMNLSGIVVSSFIYCNFSFLFCENNANTSSCSSLQTLQFSSSFFQNHSHFSTNCFYTYMVCIYIII